MSCTPYTVIEDGIEMNGKRRRSNIAVEVLTVGVARLKKKKKKKKTKKKQIGARSGPGRCAKYLPVWSQRGCGLGSEHSVR